MVKSFSGKIKIIKKLRNCYLLLNYVFVFNRVKSSQELKMVPHSIF